MDNFYEELNLLVESKVRLIEVVTPEWQRLQTYVDKISKENTCEWRRWNHSKGIVKKQGDVSNGTTDPIAAINFFLKDEDDYILIMENLGMFYNSVVLTNLLYEVCKHQKTNNKTIIIQSIDITTPKFLQKEVSVLYMGMPDKEFIKKIAETVIMNNNLKSTNFKITDELLSSVLGLTTTEVELAFTKATLNFGKLDDTVIPFLISQKEQIIKKDGLLEYYHSKEQMDDVGGLHNLKEWLSVRKKAFSLEAKEFGIDTPKGVLLLGVPGCGKSLTAKSIENAWNFPLLKFDLGKVYGGIVGQSEGNIRRALDVAKALSPCILWIDEIEKGLSGLSSSDRTDGGTSSRVFGTLLTWMQEKTEPVFIVATANDVECLPPELLRKGRFDEIFFVDIPSKKEREEIIKIHLKNKKQDFNNFDIKELVESSKGLTGAEIYNAVADSLFHAFNEDRSLKTTDIVKEMNNVVSISSVMSEKISHLRDFAKSRARIAGEIYSEKNDTSNVVRLKSEVVNHFLD